MRLVDHHHGVPGEKWIVLQQLDEHGTGHEDQDGVRLVLCLKADVVADLLANTHIHFLGHPFRNRRSGEPAGLRARDGVFPASRVEVEPLFDQELRELRGLARPRGSREHDHLSSSHLLEEGVAEAPRWKPLPRAEEDPVVPRVPLATQRVEGR